MRIFNVSWMTEHVLYESSKNKYNFLKLFCIKALPLAAFCVTVAVSCLQSSW